MPQHSYAIGDTVVLKSGTFRRGENTNQCRIVSVLPHAYGLAQYRVRFDMENWERRVTEDDIDAAASGDSRRMPDKASVGSTGSWVDLNKIKIKK